MYCLGLFFLGPPEIRIDDRLALFPIRKAIALLAYLSVTSRSHPRDSLSAILWPELNQSRARASLRHALWAIGSAGLVDWIAIDQEMVGLKPGFDLDVSAFHEKLVQARAHEPAHDQAANSVCGTCLTLLTEAAGLYRGDFLAGFTLRDSPEFDDWQLFQAEGLRQELAEVLERLAGLYSAAGEWEQALPYARRWLSLDPLHEPAHRALMRLYAYSGKRGLVLKQYETLRQTLDRELGVEPEATTRQIYEDFLAGRFAGAAPRPIPSPAPVQASHLQDLPSPLTPLLGRDADVSAVCTSLLRGDTHLLTLMGAPGIGKTRLSIQVASELVEHFQDGVYFIPLAPISDPDKLAITITQTLRIIESGDWTPVTALKNYFRNKSMLLVLDNFEQVIAAASLVADLLQSCPGLKILATSRAPLKISGERQYSLAPLQLPDPDRSLPIDALAQIPALALFVARANLVDPEFALTSANASLVAEICRQLDGLPLAIELAAAWIKLLPPQNLYNRLSNRLSLLRGGPVDLPPRQRTLRAAIDWSYELLDDWEQVLLARLANFVGGWTLEAAATVAGWDGGKASDGPAGDVIEGLLNLVDKSLVQRPEGPPGHIRFTMLETIHEYAAEKLAQRGEKEISGQRHAAYYLELAEASESALRSPQQQLWLNSLTAEHNNLRAALQWALDHQEADMAIQLAGSLWRYWWMRGQLSEGRDWLEKSLALSGSQEQALRARALQGTGILARTQGDFASARRFLEESLNIRRDLADRSGMAAALNSLGGLALYQGEYDLSFEYHQESLRYRRELGTTRDIAVSLNSLAMVAQEKGAFAQAEELYRESLALFHEVKDFRSIAAVLANHGSLMNDQGDADRAEASFRESLSIVKELGQPDDIIECLEGFAGVAVLRQQSGRGARLYGAVQALRAAIGSPMPPYKQVRYRRFLEKVSAYLNPKTLETDLEAGKKMSLEDAIVHALDEQDTATTPPLL